MTEGNLIMSGKLQVLAVDDDPASLELILEYLDEGEFETTTATDGKDAWTLLERHPERFDVVLTDRNMPTMNGMELLRRIKRHRELGSLPVIMQTAAADRADIVEGISAGAYYYLTKPFEGVVLVSMVRAAATDYERYKALQTEVLKDAGMLALMRTGLFEFRTPEEAIDLGAFLAKACPDPERVVLGLTELLMNAVEHGNLEITYEEKSELNRDGSWYEEIERRLRSARYAGRTARTRFMRAGDRIDFAVEDQGPGFDPRPYLQIDPGRVFDSHGRGIAMANLLSFDHLEYRRGGREVIATVNCSAGGGTI